MNCTKCYDYFGSQATDGMCSICYKIENSQEIYLEIKKELKKFHSKSKFMKNVMIMNKNQIRALREPMAKLNVEDLPQVFLGYHTEINIKNNPMIPHLLGSNLFRYIWIVHNQYLRFSSYRDVRDC